MSLEIKYNTICSIPSDIINHLPRFVKMVNDLNAQHVIELGTRTGVSTLAWLYALEKTGGKLTSIDIDPVPPIGNYDHWNFIQSDDLDTELLSSLTTADIVFIDTSHLYEQTIKELYAYLPLVRDGGLIVLHDTELMIPETATTSEPLYPVKKAVLEFVDETKFNFVIHEDCWGLAVIEVKKK